jgi:hypothetical protein
VLVPDPSLLDFTGTPALNLFFVNDLTNMGGTIGLYVADSGSGEIECADAGCTYGVTAIRLFGAGEVVSPVVATPEPSALLLLGAGLVVLVGTTKRRVLQA